MKCRKLKLPDSLLGFPKPFWQAPCERWLEQRVKPCRRTWLKTDKGKGESHEPFRALRERGVSQNWERDRVANRQSAVVDHSSSEPELTEIWNCTQQEKANRKSNSRENLTYGNRGCSALTRRDPCFIAQVLLLTFHMPAELPAEWKRNELKSAHSYCC